MDADPSALPDDIAALKAMLLSERARQADTEALIEHLKLQIEKLKRAIYGSRAERTARLLEQMELHLEELESAATEDELAAERAAGKVKTMNVAGFTRNRPVRKPFPEHLPRERVVLPGPIACDCCGSAR